MSLSLALTISLIKVIPEVIAKVKVMVLVKVKVIGMDLGNQTKFHENLVKIRRTGPSE